MNKAMLLKQYLSYHKKSSARLPSAYQEVEYIESTGTQYIDSGLSINNPLSFKAEFKWRKTSTSTADQCLAGARYSTNYSIGYKGINCYNNKIELAPEFSTNISFNDNIDYNSVFEGGNSVTKYTQNGTTYTSSNPYNQFNTYGYNITLFAMNQGGSVQWFFIGRLYHYSFTINGTKVRDFIPCYRKSDNEIGLYDIVNNQFYTNQGTGSFLCGRPLVNIAGYEQLDYIESSGTQYIDTQVKPHNLETMIDFQYISRNGTTSDNWLLGVYGGSNERYYALNLDTASHLIGFDTTGNTTFSYAYAPQSFDRHKLLFNEYNTHKIYLDGNVISGTAPTITNSANNIYLWSFSEGQSGIRYSSIARIYYCTMKENGVLIRNLIPMRRLSDNELGLYDLVNKVFYTNQGSGSFIGGEVLKA